MARSLEKFTTGDEVEVICQDDGFRGSLYESRIVRWMPKLRRYTVEYETLVDDSDPPKKLRETLDAAHVRPRPPRRASSRFEMRQRVDAFHNEGWWAGKVSKVLEGGRRVSVIFPDSGEEMEYGLDEVRVHLEWIGGEWVLPQLENLLDMELRKGTTVEVSSDDEGFRGAWFSATIIESNGKKFLVEYKDLKTDDETKLLTETVDSMHIRPIPPDTPTDGEFKLLEEVDAFYNDGWWVGVISKVLKRSRYMVYFKKPWNEEMEFGRRELRHHHEWIGGKWRRASQVLDL